jgi:hypothetical protein
MSSSDESLARAEELLERLETTRAELERLATAEDAERALEILGELADLSRAVEEELTRAKRAAETETDARS